MNLQRVTSLDLSRDLSRNIKSIVFEEFNLSKCCQFKVGNIDKLETIQIKGGSLKGCTTATIFSTNTNNND